jgi:hypothetical protein
VSVAPVARTLLRASAIQPPLSISADVKNPAAAGEASRAQTFGPALSGVARPEGIN